MRRQAVTESCELQWQLDATDRIVWVSGEWDAVAGQSGSGAVADRVLGSRIFDHIADIETRELYRTLFERVRRDRVRVELPFRYDAPDVRRVMRLTMEPVGDDSSLRLASTLLLEASGVRRRHEPSGPVIQPITACSYCLRMQLSDESWVQPEEMAARLRVFERPRVPRLSHGVCPGCTPRFKKMFVNG